MLSPWFPLRNHCELVQTSANRCKSVQQRGSKVQVRDGAYEGRASSVERGQADRFPLSRFPDFRFSAFPKRSAYNLHFPTCGYLTSAGGEWLINETGSLLIKHTVGFWMAFRIGNKRQPSFNSVGRTRPDRHYRTWDLPRTFIIHPFTHQPARVCRLIGAHIPSASRSSFARNTVR